MDPDVTIQHLVAVTEGGCWNWIGSVDRTGYGRIHRKGRTKMAHRFSWEQSIGTIPEGMVLDHLCHDPKTCKGGWHCPHRRCVNPAHLEVVTPKANASRGGSANQTGTCKNGHSWLPGNDGCRQCERERKRKWAAKKVPCPICGFIGQQQHLPRHVSLKHQKPR